MRPRGNKGACASTVAVLVASLLLGSAAVARAPSPPTVSARVAIRPAGGPAKSTEKKTVERKTVERKNIGKKVADKNAANEKTRDLKSAGASGRADARAPKGDRGGPQTARHPSDATSKRGRSGQPAIGSASPGCRTP